MYISRAFFVFQKQKRSFNKRLSNGISTKQVLIYARLCLETHRQTIRSACFSRNVNVHC